MDNTDLPVRKANRLKCYDYSCVGGYYITICTSGKTCLFWSRNRQLSELGRIAEEAVRSIPQYYPGVNVDKYVIMPNHIHLILIVDRQYLTAVSVSRMIRQMKSFVSKRTGYSIWQKSFYDHVIRNQKDYEEIWLYIENNPKAWLAAGKQW